MPLACAAAVFTPNAEPPPGGELKSGAVPIAPDLTIDGFSEAPETEAGFVDGEAISLVDVETLCIADEAIEADGEVAAGKWIQGIERSVVVGATCAFGVEPS